MCVSALPKGGVGGGILEGRKECDTPLCYPDSICTHDNRSMTTVPPPLPGMGLSCSKCHKVVSELAHCVLEGVCVFICVQFHATCIQKCVCEHR